MNEKARQRNELIMELGILIQPMVDLVGAGAAPTLSQYRIACAKIQSGDAGWRTSVKKLTSWAPDIIMGTQLNRTSHVVERFLTNVNSRISEAAKSNDTDGLQSGCAIEVDRMKEDFYDCLSEIPVEWEPEIFAANTPFTAYIKIKDAISTASSRMHYSDRYLRADFFDLFLRDIGRSIELRLVTTRGNGQYGTSGVRAVSEIARKEFHDYQLIEVNRSELHDRNLIVDTTVFSLGPGVDRAGFDLTNFAPSESSAMAQAEFVRIVGAGTIVHQS